MCCLPLSLEYPELPLVLCVAYNTENPCCDRRSAQRKHRKALELFVDFLTNDVHNKEEKEALRTVSDLLRVFRMEHAPVTKPRRTFLPAGAPRRFFLFFSSLPSMDAWC